jgi:hypothetical protein
MPQVAALTSLAEDDVLQGAGRIDGWLKGVAGVGLKDVQQRAPGGVALGTSMALVDSVADLLYLTAAAVEDNDWTRFAINLLGLYAGAEGGVRIGLRVVLHTLRERILSHPAGLTGADVSRLIAHINATHAGEIDTYANALPGILPGFLAEAGRWERGWRTNWRARWTV